MENYFETITEFFLFVFYLNLKKTFKVLRETTMLLMIILRWVTQKIQRLTISTEKQTIFTFRIQNVDNFQGIIHIAVSVKNMELS